MPSIEKYWLEREREDGSVLSWELHGCHTENRCGRE